ncbi:MAG: (2Fe-2S)-binding protein [Alphaproteobacteria bacterium]|nr:(2Fe-2S)-binding protein [Alphaproteobacteria bacterium]
MVSDLRIGGSVDRPVLVDFAVDGRTVSAPAGESVAAAMLAAGLLELRTSPRSGSGRGAFCYMGICQECLVRIDGAPAQACITPVRAGMRVSTGGVRTS